MSQLDLAGAQSVLTMDRLKAIAMRQWWVVVALGFLSVAGAAGYLEIRPPSYSSSVSAFTGVAAASVDQTSSASGPSLPAPTDEALSQSVFDAAANAAKLPVSEIHLSVAASPDGTQLFMTATEPTSAGAVRAVASAEQAFIAVRAHDLQVLALQAQQPLGALSQKIKSLNAQLSSLKRRTGLRGKEVVLQRSALSVAITTLTQEYSSLYSQQVQLQVAAESVRPVQSGLPSAQLLPQGKKKVLAIALGAGLLAGCGVALLRDLFRDRFTDPAEIAELESLPLLAELPAVRLRRRKTIIDAFRGRLGEGARELRAAVAMAPLRRPIRSVLVTSAAPREGKSLVATSLAVASALSGARTVLVSSDLRHSGVERLLGEPVPVRGLAQFLQNGSYEYSARPVITLDGPTDVMSATPVGGLVLVSAGPAIANPVDLLSSKAMSDWVTMVKEDSDLVVFDSPPALAVADAQVLASYADAVVLVVARWRSTKADVRRALRLLERNRAHLLGYVITGAEQPPIRSYRYGQAGTAPTRKQTKARARVT